jgi:hypothetical protein
MPLQPFPLSNPPPPAASASHLLISLIIIIVTPSLSPLRIRFPQRLAVRMIGPIQWMPYSISSPNLPLSPTEGTIPVLHSSPCCCPIILSVHSPESSSLSLNQFKHFSDPCYASQQQSLRSAAAVCELCVGVGLLLAEPRKILCSQ